MEIIGENMSEKIFADNCFFCHDSQFCKEVEIDAVFGDIRTNFDVGVCWKCFRKAKKKEITDKELAEGE